MAKARWTKEWPTRPGLYWFYGWQYGRTDDGKPIPPSLRFVRVMEFAEILVLCEGHPIAKSGKDAAIGMFCELEFDKEENEVLSGTASLPKPPDVSGLVPEKDKK